MREPLHPSVYFTEAFANLFSSKLRSFLAVLGILVGTASVVAMVSAGQLATEQALKQFKELGTDLFSVSLYPHERGAQKILDDFSIEDAKALDKISPEIKSLAPYTVVYSDLSFQSQRINGNVIGATEALQEVIKINIREGRFVSDLDGYAYYCVIGNDIDFLLKKKGVFDPIGEQIKVGKAIFTIIGVADVWPENSFFTQNVNQSIIVPIEASMTLAKNATVNQIILRLFKDADLDAVQNQIRTHLGSKLPGVNVYTRSARQIIKTMTEQSKIFTLLLGLIGSISLLVGGIGVMNIMLVSVTERKREIGIRMAVGARGRDIRALFLIESMTLSLFGGILGVILGILITFIIASFAHWHFELLLFPPFIGCLVSVAVGIFFGFYPAHKASQLDPIQTLRSE